MECNPLGVYSLTKVLTVRTQRIWISGIGATLHPRCSDQFKAQKMSNSRSSASWRLFDISVREGGPDFGCPLRLLDNIRAGLGDHTHVVMLVLEETRALRDRGFDH